MSTISTIWTYIFYLSFKNTIFSRFDSKLDRDAGILESFEAECLRAINAFGLDAHIGFLHEMNPSKNSLAYDLQETFIFLVDLSVISLIEAPGTILSQPLCMIKRV
jgi:hypothetical protein